MTMPEASPKPQAPKFDKGEHILYVNRDGTLADATVVQVDRSIWPVQVSSVSACYRFTSAFHCA